LLITSKIPALEQEISERAFAAHNIKNQDLPSGMTIEYTAGADNLFSIACTFKFFRNFAGCK
jgi:hypothetical protein